MQDFKIIEFFENSTLLNIKNLSPVQKVTLKAIMGEPLDATTPITKTHVYQDKEFDNEIALFKHFSGKTEYIPCFYSDPALAWGRRSGKSTTIGAGLAIYFATKFDYTPYLGTSPWATIPIISPTKEQAGEVYQAIKNFFLRSPYLFKNYLDGKIENIKDEYAEDELKNNGTLTGGIIKLNCKVIIKVMAADVSKVRGMAVPFAILDECCFFGVDGNDTKNTDKGIYEALAPSLSQFQEVEGMALVLKISSPNGQAGLMYDDYENRQDPDILHMQVPSWYANPTLSIKYLEKQKKKGTSYFNREYGAQYTASEAAYLDPNLIDDAIIRGIQRIEFNPKYRYAAVMDYATKDDYWAFGIGHKEYSELAEGGKKERVVVDFLHHWRGTGGAELDPSKVIDELCTYLKSYKVAFCISDQYAFAAIKPYFQGNGCAVKEFKVAHQSKTAYMYSLQVGINSKQLKIVHNQVAVKHLKDLREKRSTVANRLRIEAAANCHDDYANVIALIQYQFDKNSPIYIGLWKADPDAPPPSKDARGHQIRTPTAEELADHVGLVGFYDNKAEEEAKADDDDDDGTNFWFVFSLLGVVSVKMLQAMFYTIPFI